MGGSHDDPPCGVDLPCHLITLLYRMPEDFLEHQDHILVAVIVIIEQHHVVGRQPFGLLLFLLYRPGNRICHTSSHPDTCNLMPLSTPLPLRLTLFEERAHPFLGVCE